MNIRLIGDLIDAALRAKQLDGLSDTLRVLADACGARACVLWELAPDCPRGPDGRPVPEGWLFALAEWSPGGPFLLLHDLELGRTVTGQAVLSKEPVFVPNIDDVPIGIREREYLRANDVRSFMSVPLHAGLDGAVTMYWTAPDAASEDRRRTLEEAAPLVPALYHALSSRVGTELLRSVDAALQQHETSGDLTEGSLAQAAQKICSRVAASLRCRESSLTLEDAVDSLTALKVRVTTWPESPMQVGDPERPSYTIARWIIAEAKPLHVFDLGSFNSSRPLAPNLTIDGPSVAEAVKKGLGVDNEGSLYRPRVPLSLVATPVTGGGRTVGALQCLATSSYFSVREAATLENIGALVGRWWAACIERRRVRRENDVWRSLVSGIKSVNEVAQKELTRDLPNYGVIKAEAAKMVLKTIPSTELPRFQNSGSDSQLISMIALAKGSSDSDPLPAAAALFKAQIELYERLVHTVVQVKRAEATERAAIQQQVQVFEDLAHQLRSPILQAHTRARQLSEAKIPPEIRDAVNPVRGLLGKARRVALNISLFRALAEDQLITPKLKPLTADLIRQRLIEAAADAELIIDPARHIEVLLEKRSLKDTDMLGTLVDYDLLEQAVTNIVDNAAKYSYPDTRIRIYGGLTGSNRFQISISNRGLPIRAQDLRNITERGWRGQEAQLTTGEGSGIGLWIVDRIMHAHGGELVVVPTDARDETVVKLVFPRGK